MSARSNSRVADSTSNDATAQLPMQIRRAYEQTCHALDDARVAHDKALVDSGCNKAQLDKLAGEVGLRSLKADDADAEYRQSIDAANERQRQYYDEDLPRVMQTLQTVEERRMDSVQDTLAKYARSCLNVMPEISNVYASMLDAADAVRRDDDLTMFIARTRKIGPLRERPLTYESYYKKQAGKTMQLIRKRTIGCGGSSRGGDSARGRGSSMGSGADAVSTRSERPTSVDLSGLPLLEAVDVARKRIIELEHDINVEEKKHAGVRTLAVATEAQPKLADRAVIAEIQVQLHDCEDVLGRVLPCCGGFKSVACR